jgi:hypothetical protein
LVLPRWDSAAGEFADGSATIREAFVRLVMTYGRPGATSAGVDHALVAQAPAVDILGRARGGAPDVGAFEWVASADFTGDGEVDGDDFVQWKGDFGVDGGSDADGDGDSDGVDFLAWQREWDGGAGGVAVPEAEGVGWIIVLAIAGARRCRTYFLRSHPCGEGYGGG